MKLAMKAKGETAPNPMVGALVVKDGKIIGKGCHEKAGLAHAEVIALDEAANKAKLKLKKAGTGILGAVTSIGSAINDNILKRGHKLGGDSKTSNLIFDKGSNYMI